MSKTVQLLQIQEATAIANFWHRAIIFPSILFFWKVNFCKWSQTWIAEVGTRWGRSWRHKRIWNPTFELSMRNYVLSVNRMAWILIKWESTNNSKWRVRPCSFIHEFVRCFVCFILFVCSIGSFVSIWNCFVCSLVRCSFVRNHLGSSRLAQGLPTQASPMEMFVQSMQWSQTSQTLRESN